MAAARCEGFSFPRSAWERKSGRSASSRAAKGTRSVGTRVICDGGFLTASCFSFVPPCVVPCRGVSWPCSYAPGIFPFGVAERYYQVQPAWPVPHPACGLALAWRTVELERIFGKSGFLRKELT